MRPPSENFRSRASTFHSMSVGGLLVGLLKKISYSIFKRRSCVSRTVSSSSMVTKNLRTQFIGMEAVRARYRRVTKGHGTKVRGRKSCVLSAVLRRFMPLRSEEPPRDPHQERVGLAESLELMADSYFEFDAIFLTMASTSLRSLSFRLVA